MSQVRCSDVGIQVCYTWVFLCEVRLRIAILNILKLKVSFVNSFEIINKHRTKTKENLV